MTTWLITGASGGIGRAVAEQLLERGDRVAALARRADALQELADAHPGLVWTRAVDVTDVAALRGAVRAAFAELGTIDVVFSNAGGGAVGAVEELSDDAIEQQIALNLRAPIQLSRAVLPHLRAQGYGRIVQTSTMGGQFSSGGASMYHSTKWAVEGFMEALRQEVAPFGIGVTLIEPGSVRTQFGGNLSVAEPMADYADIPIAGLHQVLSAPGANITDSAPGDPQLVATAIIDAAELPEPPRRVLLGSDAYAAVRNALQDRLAEVDAQRGVAGRTDSDHTTTPFATPFTKATTAAEVVDGVDLTGRRAIVTGASSGIGEETARVLASAGAEITLAVRTPASGEEAAERIRAAVPAARIRVEQLDLADLDSVRAFTARWTGPLHIVVENAGIMAIPERRFIDGWESQFAVNHLGHAELLLGLRPALAETGDARVVVVSSSAHLMAGVDFDDLNFETRDYDPWVAYAQSKSAAILFARAAASHFAGDGITVNALHPGTIMTNLQRHLDDDALTWVGAKDEDGTTLEVPPGWKTVPQGAATSVLLAASPLVAGVTGRYFEDLHEAPVVDEPQTGGSGLASWAADDRAAARIWDETRRILGRA